MINEMNWSIFLVSKSPSPIPFADDDVSEPEDNEIPPIEAQDYEVITNSLQTATKENATSVENLLYFQAAIEEDDVYQDIGETEDDTTAMNTIKYLSENDVETELFSTAESSQVDGTAEENEDITEIHSEIVDEEMKDVMEKLDQDLHRIVQISDEIEKAMAVNELQQTNEILSDDYGDLQDVEEEFNQVEAMAEKTDEPESVEKVQALKEEVFEAQQIIELKLPEEGDEEPYTMQEPEEVESDDNFDQDEELGQADFMSNTENDTDPEEFETANILVDDNTVPMAIEEDDEDFNDIDYIDEEEGVDIEDNAEALSDDPESVDDMQRPFSADIFERHVQQVIEEDFPDNNDAKAPAVQIISSKLNQIMSREAVANKSTPDVVAPYEVQYLFSIFLLSTILIF